MLSNAYFLAKFRFDTAENEPAKNLQNFAKFANFADSNPLTLTIECPPEVRGLPRRGVDLRCEPHARRRDRRARLRARRFPATRGGEKKKLMLFEGSG